MTRRLAQEEGLLVGISSGANLAGALQGGAQGRGDGGGVLRRRRALPVGALLGEPARKARRSAAPTDARPTTTARTTSRRVPVESARARAVARVRSHGLPARQASTRRRWRTSRTSSATSGARASRTGPYGIAEEAVVQLLFPKGHPYYGNVIGSHEDIQAAKLDDVKQFFKQYYAPNNASLAIVGDFDPAQAQGARREVLRHAEARAAGAADHGRDAEDHRRAAARSSTIASSCRASTWRGSRRRSSSRATPTPTSRRRFSAAAARAAVQEAGLREADRAERQRRAAVADPRLAVPDRGDRAARAHGRRAREGDRRGAGRRSARRRRTRAKSSARATRSRRSIIGGLESARRLRRRGRSAELVQPLPAARPTTCRRTSSATARSRPPSVQAFAQRSAAAERARRGARGARASRTLGAQVPTPPPRQATPGAGRRVGQCRRAVAQGAAEGRRRATAAAADAGVGQLAERPDADPQHRAAGCRSSRRISWSGPAATRIRSTSRAWRTSPPRCSTQGTATRNALQIADELAQLGATLDTNSTMDASIVDGAVAEEEFRRRRST